MDQFRISRFARVLAAGRDSVVWMTASKQGLYSAPYVGEIAAMLLTPANKDDVFERFPGAAAALAGLWQRGLVESTRMPGALAQLCRECGIPPQSRQRKAWLEGVTLFSYGPEDTTARMREALESYGIAEGAGGGLRIVVTCDYLDARLGEQEGLWCPLQLTGEEIRVGPFFGGSEGPCWYCLAPRLHENSWLRTQIAPPGAALFDSYANDNRLRAAAEIAARHIARWLLGAAPGADRMLWNFSWATLESHSHAVIRLPHHPHCGRPPANRVSVPRLETAPALPETGRSASAQEVIDRLKQFVSPVTGMVRRLERCDLAASPPVFTYGAVYNPALPPSELRTIQGLIEPNVCSGRGWSADEAKAACLAEAIERYSCQFHGDERRIAACFGDLGGQAIHPDRVLLMSGAQRSGREAWNSAHDANLAIPEPFDENEEIEWAEGWSLDTEERRYLPMALCSQYYRPAGKRWIGDAESTGCAAGACIEEAILYGLLELIERDALATWWFNRVERPAFAPDEIEPAAPQRVCQQLSVLGWSVWLADITTDLDIPVVLAVAQREGAWIRASACHLEGSLALSQALAELWQLSRAASRPGPPPTHCGLAPMPERYAPQNRAPVTDLRLAVTKCHRKLSHAGIETSIFDLTRAEIGFPVVRVVAPGLRSTKPRFAPGRLYDVPVRLGWLIAPRREEELRQEPG